MAAIFPREVIPENFCSDVEEWGTIKLGYIAHSFRLTFLGQTFQDFAGKSICAPSLPMGKDFYKSQRHRGNAP